MKNYSLLSLLASIVIALLIASCSDNQPVKIGSDNVSFYEVPLVCGADESIGCGSRAKPPLLEMEKHPAIKEAWLNHAGTIYAIVWRSGDSTETVAKKIFDKYEIEFTPVKDTAELISSFRKENEWYKGADVDKLSIIEANSIATGVIEIGKQYGSLTAEEAAKIKTEIEAYFKEELVKIRTKEELFEDSDNKFMMDMAAIFEKHIGKERTELIAAAYKKQREEEVKESCCTKDSKECCNHKEE